jgi:hypothetical protein
VKPTDIGTADGRRGGSPSRWELHDLLDLSNHDLHLSDRHAGDLLQAEAIEPAEESDPEL